MRRLTLLTNPDICNLRCPLCFLNQRGRPFGMGEMPFEVAKAAIDRYAGDGLQEVIPSTIGEPLLYSKFAELLDCCGAKKIPLNLTTNGSFPEIWKSPAGMKRLLLACRDVKVSCMAFDEAGFAEMMPGLTFQKWRENVLGLLNVRQTLVSAMDASVATVSLQVTLHKKLLPFALDIMHFAESVGISRIKWNMPVFISTGKSLQREYGVDVAEVRNLRDMLKSNCVRCEGSLFFAERRFGAVPAGGDLLVNRRCDFFRDEVWILPDGSEEFCPNPERRFGDCASAGAKCERCVLLYP